MNKSSMKNLHLSIEGSYSSLTLSLFQEKSIIETVSLDNLRASSLLIPTISKLIKQHGIKLSDLSFISANIGPGAFTSLRVVIATVNGLAYATKIPLVPVKGLDALSFLLAEKGEKIESALKNYAFCVALNAYGNELFFNCGEINNSQILFDKKDGYLELDSFFKFLKSFYRSKNKTCVLCGNALTFYKKEFTEFFSQINKDKFFLIPTLSTANSEIIGKMGWQLWQQGISHSKILPYYIKSQKFAVRVSSTNDT